jgi:hypothetical protein
MNKILKTKKIYIAFLSIIAFSISFFIQSCSNEFDDFAESEIQKPIYRDYLKIEDLSSKTVLSDKEKEIMKEAKKRINAAIIIDNEGNLIIGVSSQKLNMSDDLFYMFSELISFCNENYSDYIPIEKIRLKSDPEPETAIDPCDILGSAIEALAGSNFEKECFRDYWNGSGNDKTLTPNTFNDIANEAPAPTNVHSVNINGQSYYEGTVNFYSVPEYDYAFGTATMFYDNNMTPVGFQDDYDFNKGLRSIVPETITRTINILGSACGASNYSIHYGIYSD